MLSKDTSGVPPLCCPVDGAVLTPHGRDGLRCAQCARVFPVRLGVAILLAQRDDFYEGAYLNHVRYVPPSEAWYHQLPLWLITNGYVWAVRRWIPKGATVIELGCAGGVAYFGSRYAMIGLDLSFESLLGAAPHYALCAEADVAKRIPLPDQSVDAVVSSYFWEHIPADLKSNILAECRRVLRPNGRLVFVYDVETQNSLISRLRTANDARYRQLFVEQDGHLGYQSASRNEETFRAEGFDIIRHTSMERTWLQSPSVYTKAAEWPGITGRIAKFGSRLGSSPWFLPYTALVRIVDDTVGRLFDPTHGRIAITIAQRSN